MSDAPQTYTITVPRSQTQKACIMQFAIHGRDVYLPGTVTTLGKHEIEALAARSEVRSLMTKQRRRLFLSTWLQAIDPNNADNIGTIAATCRRRV